MVEKGVWSGCRKPHPLVTREECGENGRCGREGGRLESLFIEGREVEGEGKEGEMYQIKVSSRQSVRCPNSAKYYMYVNYL